MSIPTLTVEGLYDVTATITDSASNTSSDPSSSELLIDTTLPITPTVVPQFTSNTTPVISGTANAGPGETLTVTVDDVTYTVGDGTLMDNGDGTWDLTIPTALAEGSYDVIATVTDAAGNASVDTSTGELVIDTTPPVAPTVNTLVTNTATPVISGTTSTVPGETLTVNVNGITYTEGDGNLVVNADGTWDLTIPATDTIDDGTYDVIATITDLSGNATSDASTNELTVDTNPPVVPTVATQNTNNTMPVISGTATVASGETLTVTINGMTYTAGDGNLTDNGDGTWTLVVSNTLADNTYPVTVTVIDVAGNVSTDVSTSELVIDTTSPAEPTVTPHNTSDDTPVISGTATVAPGDTLTVTVDGVTYTAGDGNLIDNGDGTWTLSIPSALSDGIYDVIVTVTDAAGNSSSDSGTGELVIDTTPPATPTVESLTTEDPMPTLSGTAVTSPGDTLTVTVDDITYTAGDGSLIDNGDGTWTLNLPIDLAVGIYDVQVSITDSVGNTAVSEPGKLTIQTPSIAPGEPVTPPDADFDGDGIPDSIDLDDDNDGIPDTTEGSFDSDGDGHPDFQDLDSDNDGIADIVEVGGDDINNDYLVDDFIDTDNNGLSDDLQLFPFELIDTDSDLIADYRDLDSDNDGLTDLLESGGVDNDNNGRIDNFIDDNNDGADDNNQINGPSGRDTDEDGIPNRLDLDTDNDGLFDLVESGGFDDLNDGILDSLQDIDLDGIPDSVDVDITLGEDTDGDGIDDRFDVTFLDESDTDGDGIVDSADPDANGDGFADDVLNNLALGQALPDSNGNGAVDVLEPDEDGIIHAGLSGVGGVGCSIFSGANTKTSIDPLFLLLLASSSVYLWRRSSVRRRAR